MRPRAESEVDETMFVLLVHRAILDRLSGDEFDRVGEAGIRASIA